MTPVPQEFAVPTRDGTMPAWRHAPQGDGPWPAVVVLMDAPGIRPELHAMSRRLADAGYLALLPDLYHRLGRGLSVGPTRDHPDADANRERMMALIRTLSNAAVVRDVGALVDALDADAGWDRGPVGLTGYCMSGRFAVLAAAAMPGRVGCAASWFGTRLVTDEADSPHRSLAGTCGELYFAFAEHDHYAPAASIETLRRALADSDVRHAVDVYEGTEHGFVFRDRGSHHAGAAARHWDTLLALLGRNLGRAAAGR